MGSHVSKAEREHCTHILSITTGDKKGANVNAKVYVTFKNDEGQSQEITITKNHKHHFKKGDIHNFYVTLDFVSKITDIEIRRDHTGHNNEWFVELATISLNKPYTDIIDAVDGKSVSYFPINRWIKASSTLKVQENDSVLPQFEMHEEQRALELAFTRDVYLLSEKILGAPPQVEKLPDDEQFSQEYQREFVTTFTIDNLASDVVDAFHKPIDSIDDYEKLYHTKALPLPTSASHWRKDESFADQKLTGCNPCIIELCTKFPEHMDISKSELEVFLEGHDFEEALQAKRLYMIDLRYLADIECLHNKKMPGPTCLLYVRNSQQLVPIAIQLMPEKADDNPVFTPSDPAITWLAAKMWFNMADCSHHQSVAHLGFTHLMMESVVVCTKRKLSLSHPIHRLLAPHFIYLLAINDKAISSLVSHGGWVDKAMHIGRTGMFNIIKKKWETWSVKENGSLVNDLRRRGVEDAEALPGYHYRDDALLLWNAIQTYVAKIVENVYDSKKKLVEDKEIQGWLQELKEASFKGIPDTFKSTDEVVEVVTVFIFTSSVQHAAVNFGQYNQYAYPPNYPTDLHESRPTNKEPLTEDYLVKALPNKHQTTDVMMITDILSQKATNSLGDFETQYAYDKTSVNALISFQGELKSISEIIKQRNNTRSNPYDILLPEHIPNAISI